MTASGFPAAAARCSAVAPFASARSDRRPPRAAPSRPPAIARAARRPAAACSAPMRVVAFTFACARDQRHASSPSRRARPPSAARSCRRPAATFTSAPCAIELLHRGRVAAFCAASATAGVRAGGIGSVTLTACVLLLRECRCARREQQRRSRAELTRFMRASSSDAECELAGAVAEALHVVKPSLCMSERNTLAIGVPSGALRCSCRRACRSP